MFRGLGCWDIGCWSTGVICRDVGVLRTMWLFKPEAEDGLGAGTCGVYSDWDMH